MNFELMIFGIIFCGMIYLFLTEKLPIDVTALLSLILIVMTGLIKPSEAFKGFSSDAVILMIATFFVSGGLRHTGVGDRMSKYLSAYAGDSEAKAVAAVVLTGAFLSSFMNNVAATAVMLPAVAGVASRSKVAPSKLFLPLSFGVLLGGTTTLIGTSSNMIASEVLRSQGLEPFHFLDFTLLGLLLVIFGGGFIAILGRKFLPGKSDKDSLGEDADLPHLYRLKERLFALKIQENSSLDGESLESLKFGEVLGAEVIAIKRGDATVLSPGAKDIVKGGDRLIVRGRLNELQTLFRLHGARVLPFGENNLLSSQVTLSVARVRPTKKLLSMGKSLAELAFRKRFKIHALSIERDQHRFEDNIAHVRILESDVIRVVGESSAIEGLKGNSDFLEFEGILPLDTVKGDAVFQLHLPQKSGLDDVMIRESRLGELVKLTVIGIIREKELRLAVSGDELIKSGDTLIVAGKSSHAERLAQLSSLEIEEDPGPIDFESSGVGLLEVVLAPRSKLIGKSLEDVSFAERYGFRVLAVWRDGEPRRARFAKIPMQFGDALLLQGPRTRMHLFSRDSDFVVLSGLKTAPFRSEKASWAIVSLAILIILSALSIYPPHVAAVIAAVVAILSGTLTMEEAYREVEWRVVLLVAALLPFGAIVDHLGISGAISHFVLAHINGLGVTGIVLLLTLSSSIFSQLLDSSITVVVLSPIAISLSKSLPISPQSLVMSVAIGASIAFLTPFSHRAHLLIMGPGGYRSVDFWKIGLWLTGITLIITVGLLSFFG